MVAGPTSFAAHFGRTKHEVGTSFKSARVVGAHVHPHSEYAHMLELRCDSCVARCAPLLS